MSVNLDDLSCCLLESHFVYRAKIMKIRKLLGTGDAWPLCPSRQEARAQEGDCPEED